MAAEDVDEILDEVDFQGWSIVVDPVASVLQELATTAGVEEFFPLGVDAEQEDVYRMVNQRAVDWARDRGAELVGMTFDENDNLIPNPDPVYAITDGTREMIRTAVSRALDEGWTPMELRERLQDNEAFSNERALNIARTETAGAVGHGSMEGAYVAGMDEKKWLASAGACGDCEDNDDAGWIDIDDDFPSGDDTVGAHPNCTCDVIYRRTEEEKLFKVDFDPAKHPKDEKGRFTTTGGAGEEGKHVVTISHIYANNDDVHTMRVAIGNAIDALPSKLWDTLGHVNVSIVWAFQEHGVLGDTIRDKVRMATEVRMGDTTYKAHDQQATFIHELGHVFDQQHQPPEHLIELAYDETQKMSDRSRAIFGHFVSNSNETFAELFRCRYYPQKDKSREFSTYMPKTFRMYKDFLSQFDGSKTKKSWVEKFNPNRDEKGRFSSGGGGKPDKRKAELHQKQAEYHKGEYQRHMALDRESKSPYFASKAQWHLKAQHDHQQAATFYRHGHIEEGDDASKQAWESTRRAEGGGEPEK